MHRSNEDTFSSRFVRLSDKVERAVRTAIIWTLILLVIFQCALLNERARQLLTVVEPMEGVPFAESGN